MKSHYNLLSYFRLKNIYDPIDVVIPCIDRDWCTLKELIKSLRVNCMNPIRNIYVVGPVSDLVESKATEFNYLFIDEKKIIGERFDHLKYSFHGVNRAGWLIQQFIKLNVNRISSSKFVLVIDSDTMLTQKQYFVRKSKIYLNYSDEYHLPYHIVVRKLLKLASTYEKSFVSHMMVVNTDILSELQAKLGDEKNDWIDTILEKIDLNESSCFSEFELLGNYYYHFYSNKLKLRSWNNISLNRNSEKVDFQYLNKKYSNYKSVSFHWYNCE